MIPPALTEPNPLAAVLADTVRELAEERRTSARRIEQLEEALARALAGWEAEKLLTSVALSQIHDALPTIRRLREVNQRQSAALRDLVGRVV